MICILFRHGIAADREDWARDDALRPLTQKGVKRTQAAASGLLQLGIAPDHILSSPLVRALDTAQIIREVFKLREDVQVRDELLPDAPPDKLFPALSVLPSDACVVCVGHEPNLSEVAGLMLFGQPVAGLSLKKAGACCVEFKQDPRAGHGVLHWWLTPSQLRWLAKD